MQATGDIVEALRAFGGDPQRASPLASFLGFQPISSPEDQLAGPLRGGLKWFFAQRSDNFGVRELYRVGAHDAKPGTVGLWVAVLTEWGRSTDRDRSRRRLARALVEQAPDARAMVILVPNDLQRSQHREAEFVLPRSAAAVSKGADTAAVSSVRALVDLERPNRFHRDILRELIIRPGESLLDISLKWQKEFSVERVTTRFYQEYIKVRNRMAEALLAHNKGHSVVGQLAVEDGRAWATRQMGRMLFPWFLQSKRWLGEPGGQGDRDYLVHLWQKRHQAPVQEYYRGLLVPLFFKAMAVRHRSPDVEPLGYIPYLNGGLFRRNRLEDDVDKGGEVSLPDEVFDPEDEQGVLGLLSRYRFTTRESTPDDQSVDPDPELLGRVFENLYQGDERKNTGTYYTPREIVHFMCRQALDGYLRDQTGATQETLDRLRKQVTEKEEGRQPLPPELEERLVEKLELVRVCDPAVGSGAFLVGMMQEMILLRRGIEHTKREFIQDEEDLIARWKRRAIQFSLYGVDINPEAVDICQLRLWLSLVLDVLDPRDMDPLPNLDFRIVSGDSLVDRVAGIAFKESLPSGHYQPPLSLGQKVAILEGQTARWRLEFEGTPGEDHQRLRDLRDRILRGQTQIVRLHLEHALEQAKLDAAHASGITGKKGVGTKATARVAQLNALLEGLRDDAPYQKPFLWPVNFQEVFQQGGFDVVLANPPYVRMEKIDNTDEQSYYQAFPEVKASRADILVYFYARALQILRPGGWLAFITSNKYMRAAYGEGLRSHLPLTMAVHRVLDFGDLPLFEANGKHVSAYPAVLVGRKDGDQDQHSLRVADLTYPIRRKLAEAGLKVNPENVRWVLEDLGGLLEETEVPDYPQVLLRKEGWILENPALVGLFHRLMGQGTPLGEFVKGRIYRGIVTGLNDAFVIDQAKRDELISEDPKSADIIKPWLRGRDIKRGRAEWAGLYIIFTNRGVQIARYPAVLEHLKWFRPQLEKRATAHLHPWYELQQPQEGIYAEFEQPKIIWGNMAVESKFAKDLSRAYVSAPANFLVEPAPWLLAVMNSSLLNFIYPKLTVLRGGSFQEFKIGYIEPTPIVVPGKDIQVRLQNLAQEAVRLGHVHNQVGQIEEQIDEVVFHAYGVAPTEQKLVLEWLSRRRRDSGFQAEVEEPDDDQ